MLLSCVSLLRCFLLFQIPVPAPPPPSLTALQPPSLTPLASYLYICVCIGVRSTTARRTSVALSPLWCFLSCQFAVVLFSCFSLLWCFSLVSQAQLEKKGSWTCSGTRTTCSTQDRGAWFFTPACLHFHVCGIDKKSLRPIQNNAFLTYARQDQ